MELFQRMVKWEDVPSLIRPYIHFVDEELPYSISDSYGLVASRNVVSERSIPEFPMSLVDGFALGSPDGTGTWRIIGEVLIGHEHELSIGTGECVRIATGGIVPSGTYSVVKIEEVQIDGKDTDGVVVYNGELKKGSEFVEAGSDIPKGEEVLRKGQVIGFKEITLLSALGISSVWTYRKPRVFIIVTGHEIRPPGTRLGRGETYDSTSFMLRAFLERLGTTILDVIYVGEEESEIRAAFGQCLPLADMVITTGGTSVGKADNVAKVIESLGEVIFHGVDVRPGKPMLFGVIQQTPILGFPGFVTSSLVMANLLLPKVIPWLRGLEELSLKSIKVKMAENVKGFKGWNRIVTGYVKDGMFHVSFKTSAAISSFVESEGFIHIKPNEEMVLEGTEKEFWYFLS